jgi:hypothetical protein
VPGTPGGVLPSLCSVPGDCVMVSIWPKPSRKSFNPEKAQIELACVGAAVFSSEPEPKTSGVPGGPFTSPAKAGPALAPTSASVHTAAASLLVVLSILPPWSRHHCRAKDYYGPTPLESPPKRVFEIAAFKPLALRWRRTHDPQRRLIISKSKRTSIFGSTDLLDRSTGSIPVVALCGISGCCDGRRLCRSMIGAPRGCGVMKHGG